MGGACFFRDFTRSAFHKSLDYDKITIAFLAEDMDMPDWPVYTEVGIFIVIMLAYLLALHRKRDSLAAYWDTKWKNAEPLR